MLKLQNILVDAENSIFGKRQYRKPSKKKQNKEDALK